MNVIYARKPLPKSIFLAGPTPRKPEVKSWRPEALELLKKAGFDGNVYVPEDQTWAPRESYEAQVNWEWEALSISTIVVFWVPRELETMPAFVTNVEFGYLVRNGNLVIGWPEGAPKNAYLKALGERHGLRVYHTLEEVIHTAVALTNKQL